MVCPVYGILSNLYPSAMIKKQLGFLILLAKVKCTFDDNKKVVPLFLCPQLGPSGPEGPVAAYVPLSL